MKRILLLALLPLMAISCNAQQQKNITKNESDTASNPKVSWKVNKKYDAKGNLVRYDSVYTWSYSSKNGSINQVHPDSVMTAFRKQFSTEFPSLFNKSFDNSIWTDSLLYQDFPMSNFFMQKWEDQYFDMKKIMGEMDSLKNSYIQRTYPNLKQKINNNNML